MENWSTYSDRMIKERAERQDEMRGVCSGKRGWTIALMRRTLVGLI
jgi:hypothetical protein